MIIDRLENSAKYEALNPLFKKAFEYLRSLNLAQIETGKTILDGYDLYVTVSNSSLKDKNVAKLEVHNNYIDIQLPISKAEGFGWSGRNILRNESAPFDAEKDIQFFEDTIQTYFNIEPDNFVIFFPEDGHAPCIGEGTVTKIVVKVRVVS
ncbi:MAG: YhcH/YjgK/YiaL family protein [Bacteroidales bacterium]|jgi:YhcH/YjgK/YiaL family protein|nr:YhcH/YjgK/YiaL family protein [Bacteroidales bacterium]